MTELLSETREFTPEKCPPGTIVINRGGQGALLRVDAWNGHAADISCWEGLDTEAVHTQPAAETYPGHEGLHGVEVEVLVQPQTAESTPISLADVLAANLPASVAPVAEDVVEQIEPEEVEEPVADAIESVVGVGVGIGGEDPVVETAPAATEDTDDKGPPAGEYVGWDGSKKAYVYNKVFDAGGSMTMTSLVVAAHHDHWPKLAVADVEQKILERVQELQEDGYMIAWYEDNNVVIGPYEGAEVTLESYMAEDSGQGESGSAVEEPPTDYPAPETSAPAEEPVMLPADFCLTGTDNPVADLLAEIGAAFTKCASRLATG